MEKTKELTCKLQVLAKTAKKLNEHAVSWALGSGAMLYLNSITDSFGDLDIMVNEDDIEKLASLLPELGEEKPSVPKERFKTRHFYELTKDGVEIDIIAGMVVVKDQIEYEFPFNNEMVEKCVSVFGQNVYLCDLNSWKRLYQLMGRSQKAALIEEAQKANK